MCSRWCKCLRRAKFVLLQDTISARASRPLQHTATAVAPAAVLLFQFYWLIKLKQLQSLCCCIFPTLYRSLFQRKLSALLCCQTKLSQTELASSFQDHLNTERITFASNLKQYTVVAAHQCSYIYNSLLRFSTRALTISKSQ